MTNNESDRIKSSVTYSRNPIHAKPGLGTSHGNFNVFFLISYFLKRYLLLSFMKCYISFSELKYALKSQNKH